MHRDCRRQRRKAQQEEEERRPEVGHRHRREHLRHSHKGELHTLLTLDTCREDDDGCDERHERIERHHADGCARNLSTLLEV